MATVLVFGDTYLTTLHNVNVLHLIAKTTKQTCTPRNTKNDDDNVPNAPSGSYGTFVL